jgi:hypothetical protein
MSFLGVGINGVVQLNGVAIANLKNASFSVKNDSVEEYITGSAGTGITVVHPALLAATTQHFEIKAEQLWTDNNVINDVISGGTPVTIILGPKGTATGQGLPKYTFNNCIITECDLKWDAKSAVALNFSAKAQSMNVGIF